MNEGTGNELQGYVNPPGARGPPAQYQTAANIAGTTSSRGEGTNGRYQLQLPGAGSSPGYDQAQDATYWVCALTRSQMPC
ncbi:hypothetical protein CALCODRAFT_498935 [Calocera cornea HHB12733]|uniref:Uncharacterized protein n=1 Tax=Calocera cornea HHB12733 TaxID=1353952 RepID=A0A165ENK0_9BASI|nr:hypothetical protein CALCODRAFT_498935 [Calocera cornea HHB12733]